MSATFYKDHWIKIEPDRLERYRRMFEWSPASAPLYDSADIHPGHVVADFGCGPGYTAVEIAKWVGSGGHVHALDVNTDFLADARSNAAANGFEALITIHHSDGTTLPLAEASLDRITTRNTLIYVEKPEQTLREFRRVLRPNGRMHAIEGDWPMMVVEPVRPRDWMALVEAASYACRTPDIGRKLYSMLVHAGFRDIQLQVIARPDIDGRLLPMIRNMAAYARGSGQMAEHEVDEILGLIESGLAQRTYMALAPQFVVTATPKG
jgi:ubiquinone/menaquinone biosynthesis C-methylase UbiE